MQSDPISDTRFDALLAECERLRAIVNHTSDVVFIKDLEGRYLLTNPAHSMFLGLPADRILGRYDNELLDPDHAAAIRRDDEAVLASGRPQTFERLVSSRAGESSWGLITKYPYRVGGQVVGIIGIARDITERRHMEEALRESEDRFRSLVQASFEGIAIHDKGVILDCNQGLADMFGYELHELIGMNGIETAAPECRETIRQHIVSGYDKPYEVIGIRKDGSRFNVEMVGKMSVYQGRSVRVAAFRDITERKRLEEALTSQNERLKELDRLKNSFVSSVSHELRTPLTSIRGYAEFLEDGIGGELTEQQQSFLEQIQQGARRLERLVDDLLDFARLEAGSFKLQRRETDLAGRIAELLTSVSPQATAAAICLEAELPEGGLMAVVDPDRLGQVVLNLIGNALKFTPAGGSVGVRLFGIDEGFRIEVRDTGIGIADDELPRIFNKFFQVDAGTTRTWGGAGLGLAISKALVEAHGGGMGVSSRLGEGSTFWVEIPRVS